MAKREPLEEFGRSLISCTLSEKLITGANFASTVTYFDQNYIMRTWTELVNIFKENGRMADKFKNKGYEDFTVKNIEVVQQIALTALVQICELVHFSRIAQVPI